MLPLLYYGIALTAGVILILLFTYLHRRRRLDAEADEIASLLSAEPVSPEQAPPSPGIPRPAPPAPSTRTCSLEPGPIPEQQFNRLRPIDRLDSFSRSQVHRATAVYPAGGVLFSTGDPVTSLLYLLEGTIYLELNDDSAGHEISANSLKALYPLSVGKNHLATAYAKTDVRVLPVQCEILAQQPLQHPVKGSPDDLGQLEVPEKLRLSALFHGFREHYKSQKLRLPALPNVALKLRKAMEKNISISDAVKIVQMDATIAAKLVQVANSPLYRAAEPITNCHSAVNRLGLIATKNLVLSNSIGHLFQCHKPEIRKRLQATWENSLLLSSLCYVLATKTKGVNPEEALLAGLVSDIGIIPFLHYADSLPDELYEPEELDLAMPLIRGPVGTFLLSHWDFPDQLVAVPKLSEDWYHQNDSTTLSLADIVMLSKLHSYIGTEKMAQVPFINAVPAYTKLSDGTLTPELSLDVLSRSKHKINEILKYF